MSPLNLGQIWSYDEIPASDARQLGGASAVEVVWPNVDVNFSNGSGTITIQKPNYTPYDGSYACYWRTDATIMVRSIAAAWATAYLRLALSPADLDGQSQVQTCLPTNSALTWSSMFISNIWRLAANTTYNCYLQSATTNTNLRYYQGDEHVNLNGYLIGLGVL